MKIGYIHYPLLVQALVLLNKPHTTGYETKDKSPNLTVRSHGSSLNHVFTRARKRAG